MENCGQGLHDRGGDQGDDGEVPRQPKPARLWLRPVRRDPRTGRLVSPSQWFILHRGKHIPTGCAPDEAEEAEKRLAQYIAETRKPERRERDIETIDIADVLAIYIDDCRDAQANKAKFDERMTRLATWWGGKTLADVTGETCRAYVEHRIASARKRRPKSTPGAGGARRDLEDLRSAINHHATQGFHRAIVNVWLPNKGQPRDRWLTREEAARLLWACWTAREVQRGRETARKPLRHLARFILMGLYTGSRAATIAAASPKRVEGRSYVDLDRGMFYRLQIGKKATNKRQPPVPIPPHLLSHMRRWHRLGIAKEYFVEWGGSPVTSVKTGLKSAVSLAGLDGKVTPHTLRHTAATWLMQNGVDKWEAAGFLGMSVEILDRVYGHHHPNHLRGAARGFRPKR